MKKIIVCVILIMVLASCIGQKEEWTVEDWKEHISFMRPPVGQDAASMVSGFRNVEDLPIGTHMVFDVETVGVYQGTDMTMDMTLGLTISGKDTVDGIDCTVVDLTIEMDMDTSAGSLGMTITGKEWLGSTGTPVKVEEEATMKIGEFDIPMSIEMERTGEELYHGHDCWVLTGTQTVEIMGITTAGGEILEYMDKESSAIVRAVTTIGEEEVDTGYVEPPIPVEDLKWELGNRETVTTDLGTYDCQVIYLKENGETIGTIWANEEIRAPIKYVFSYKTADINLEMTVILVEYEEA